MGKRKCYHKICSFQAFNIKLTVRKYIVVRGVVNVRGEGVLFKLGGDQY